jgi:hypothetical protein
MICRQTSVPLIRQSILEPLKGDTELSSDGRKDLDAYLVDYGREIDAKVQAVYRSAEPWAPEPGASGLTSR